MKTKKEIQKQIEGLEKIKPKVRETSAFGDNHHDAIDMQINVLKEDLSEDEICEGGEADNVRDAAISARQWLDGEYTDYDDLISSWKELVIK